MTTPKFVQTTPYVWASDIDASKRYYTEVLGFHCDFDFYWDADGERRGLAVMSRDGIQFEVRNCDCPDGKHTGLGHFQVEVNGIDELYADWKAKGVRFSWEPQTESWGHRTTRLEDPDGNYIYLWENVGHA